MSLTRTADAGLQQDQETARRAPSAPGRPRAGTWKRYRASTFYAFVAPWIVGFVLLTLFPLGFALWMSFTNYDGISPTTSFIGLDNYVRAFTDRELRGSLALTLLLMLVVVPLLPTR